MRMFPIDVEIRLSVCANNYEEARQTVIRGLHDGRYVADAKLYYAHGDGKNRRRVKFSPFDVPTKSDDVKWVVESYGSVVRIGERMTGAEFAARIRLVYDCKKHVRNRLAAKYAEEGVAEVRRTAGDRTRYRLAEGVAKA